VTALPPMVEAHALSSPVAGRGAAVAGAPAVTISAPAGRGAGGGERRAMRGRGWAVVGAAGLGLGGLALGVGLTPALAGSAPGAGLPRVLDCAGKAVYEPSSYVLACADANTYFQSLHWSSWTAGTASASGTYVANDCQPSCAAGHFHKYPGTVRLSLPKLTPYGRLFTQMRYSYTTTVVYPLPQRPLAG